MSHILLSVVMFVSVLMMNFLLSVFVVNCLMFVVDFAVMGFVMVMINLLMILLMLMLVMAIPLFVFMMMNLLMLMVLVVLIFHV
jgi:hypothetical protein